jgi:agmatinase
MQLTESVPEGRPTFANAPRADDLTTLEADIAVLGVPHGVPYDMDNLRGPSAPAPATVREQSRRFAHWLHHYDFDFGGPLFAGKEVRIVDCGDVAMIPGDFAGNSERTTRAVEAILARGAVPFVLGGDHSIPIPVMRAFANQPPFCIVQLDAHLDWREDRSGVREGLSSPMRRASELANVSAMAQIGLRGIGSARPAEVAAARAWGSVLVRAQDVHREGVDATLAKIPAAERYYVTFDADGLDPAIAPGVNGPAFGGLTYDEAFGLLRGVARLGRVIGFDFVEIVPAADVHDLTSLVAARLTLNLMGALVWEGQIGRDAPG